MNDGLTIKSVRCAGGKTSIEYRVRTDHGNDEIALETEDEPHLDFTTAFESLAGDVAVLCEIPLDPERPITVRKVAFKEKSDRFGVVLTGLRDLTGGPGAVTLNTPVRYEAADGDAAPGGDALDADQVERLRTMETEAQAFIRGKRAQGDLFHQGDVGQTAGDVAAGSLAAPAEDRQADDEEAAQAEVSFDEEAAAETQQARSTMTEAQAKLLCDVRASLAYERLKGPRKRIFKGLKDRGLVVVAQGQVAPSELGHHVLALLDAAVGRSTGPRSGGEVAS